MAAALLKVALVTGAGTGVGRAAALALMKDGFAVVLAGRRAQPLEAVAKEGQGARTLVAPTDVTSPGAVKALFAKTKAEFGRLDVLFNNAGMNAPSASLEDLPFETWQAMVDTNLTAPFLCTQAAIRLMKSQAPRGGRIINNGSIAAYKPRPCATAYAATKHAITGLTKSTALDGRRHDIACGQIDIGYAATAMTERSVAGALQADGRLMPEPRMDVDHAGRAVAHMASLPLDANVLFMTVMATSAPYVGRG